MGPLFEQALGGAAQEVGHGPIVQGKRTGGAQGPVSIGRNGWSEANRTRPLPRRDPMNLINEGCMYLARKAEFER